MMQIQTIGAARTMSSREIAELTGKEHRNVLADARKMLDELGLTLADFSADLPDALGRPQPVILLPKRESLILVSGYSVAMRARIIDRWQELEQAAAPAIPQTYAAALRLAAEQAERIEQQAIALALAAPKAATLDRITGNSNSRSLRDASRVLKVPERKLINLLLDKGWLLRATDYIDSAGNVCTGRLSAAAEARASGALEVNVIEAGGKARDVVRVTPAGIEKLGRLVPKWLTKEGGAA